MRGCAELPENGPRRGVLLMTGRVVVLFLRRGSLDEYLNRSGVLRIIDGDETRVHADLH